jgi:hypothetical protein
MKRILPVLIILAAISLLIFNSMVKDKRGNIFSTTTHHFVGRPVLQVASSHEKYCLFRCGTFHVFKTYQNGNWQEIITLRDNKVNEYPRRNINAQSENFVYFWHGSTFGVTIDGGKNWSMWRAENNDLMKDAVADDDLIEKVTIDSEGRGKMYFNSRGQQQSGVSWLKTEDYGTTWHR